MTLRRRITQLEQAAATQVRRCDLCADWPAIRVERPDDPPDLAARHPWQPPAICPSCGSTRTVIIVERVPVPLAARPEVRT